ncbi:MAG: DUF2306 domain-containing protein, partial [Terriglobia bacterium]
MRPKKRIEPILWPAVIFLAVIGAAAASHRAIVLLNPALGGNFAPAAALNANFARHPALTFVHIIPGVLFMILGPLQFVRRIRSRWLQFHRWSGRLFVASGFVIGISALVMSPQMATGGPNETAATMLFALIFLFDLGKAFLHIRRREIA